MTTGYIRGLPFYLVGDSKPTQIQRDAIRAIKSEFPTVLALKSRDLWTLNKRVPDTNPVKLKYLQPEQQAKSLRKLVGEANKAVNNSEILKSLMKILPNK